MPKISYVTLQKKYGGMYVLTDEKSGKVVAANKRLDRAFEEAEKKGFKLPAVEYIEPSDRIVIYEVKVSLSS